jgi:hypothetical protein
MYESLSEQKKNISNESVVVFWDVQCLNIGQNWERGFLQGLMHARVIVLLISAQVFFPSFSYLYFEGLTN